MSKFVKFPSIEQFRNVIRNVKEKTQFVKVDEDGNAVFDRNKELPILQYEGTVKLHGTNASVCGNKEGSIWVQSRNNIITIENDNAGFAFFVEKHKDYFEEMIDSLLNTFSNAESIAIFGEFCGEGIQKGIALSKLPKMFVIFGIKIIHFEDQKYLNKWLDSNYVHNIMEKLDTTDINIYSIKQFETYKVDIDFNKPELIQNKLIELTELVETECPVGKAFGESGIGEGIVWKPVDENYNNSGFWFKVKGEKHSVSKVKKLASVDIEKVNSINEFVEKVVTENRLNQGLDYLKEQNLEIDIKNTGTFLKWLTSDVFKEEMDTLIGSGLEPKNVGGAISTKARKWFMEKVI
jgi:hypothetical protein